MEQIKISKFDVEQMIRLLNRYLQEAPDQINGKKDGDKEMAKYLIEKISVSFEEEKTNPLSPYGVTDKEFEYFEIFYRIERLAFWKGVLLGAIASAATAILNAIIL